MPFSDPEPGWARPGTDPIGDALRWRIRKIQAEAEQHRVKAQVHLDCAADLDMKAIEYRALIRSLGRPNPKGGDRKAEGW